MLLPDLQVFGLRVHSDGCKDDKCDKCDKCEKGDKGCKDGCKEAVKVRSEIAD
jgi:hypothetical protein